MRPADGLALRLRQGAARADQLGIACPGRFLALEERPLAQAAARLLAALAGQDAAPP